ncbi:ubiquinol-cytochrome c reductase subunit 8 [Capronia epimyces CBS 606.96]|uniref:Cytochrome b-c1 complex subunit 8 n=1 Tax=Capronia epimyces CBS 606.96 TaxID=1182542 RepID=W9YGT4_9EURO|nr:ubiquinol-cytochrome c reductase subunit 8 [Capronia epimyces CBS 606.96]EXJ88850.1 ubiquinol-cytochrome c reductase subunit 8 [Capronia epimyces CBS 606.96]
MEYNQDLPKGLGREPVLCWGHKNVRKQAGVTTYTLSPNRQRPMAQAYHRAIFNTFRRSKAQFLYVAPPFIVAYLLMSWANQR